DRGRVVRQRRQRSGPAHLSCRRFRLHGGPSWRTTGVATGHVPPGENRKAPCAMSFGGPMSRRRTPRKQGMVHQENPQVRLVRLDEGSTETALLRRAVLEHDLPAEQLRFTGLPAQTLPDADGDPTASRTRSWPDRERRPSSQRPANAVPGSESWTGCCRVHWSTCRPAPYGCEPSTSGHNGRAVGSAAPRVQHLCWTVWWWRSRRTPTGSCCAWGRPTSRRSAPTAQRASTTPGTSFPEVR